MDNITFNNFFGSGRPPTVSTPTGLTAGTRAPIHGSGGGTYPPSGWTGLHNYSADDFNVSFPLNFYGFTFNNTIYTVAYVGSNTYLTFGGGSNVYSSLSASNPAFNKFFLGASDNSFQRVSVYNPGGNYARVRYEGNGTTSGTVGSPGIVFEATLFLPSAVGGFNVVEVLFGNHNMTTPAVTSGVYSTNAVYATYTQTANQSYVFVGNSTGTSWTIYTGYYMSGFGY